MKHRHMTRVADALVRFYPPYAWIPTVIIPVYNALTFYGTRLINHHYPAHIFELPVDRAIPFVPFFVLFYILAYLQWGLCYFFTLRRNRRLCAETLSVNLLAKTACLIGFLVFPTAIVRPEVTGGGVWNTLVRWIYAADTPDNLFPSIHCMASWLAFRALLKVEEIPLPVRLANGVLTLFVCASTVLIKQHYLPDIFAGILAVELGYLLTRLLGTDRRLRKWEPAVTRHYPDLVPDTRPE